MHREQKRIPVESPGSGSEGPASPEAAMPSAEHVDSLLREAEGVAKVASMSEAEVSAMIKRRQESRDRLRDIDAVRESRLRQAEKYDPLKGITSRDYEQLVEEGMIDATYAERLRLLDKTIAKMQSLDYPTMDASACLERLIEARGKIREQLASRIEEAQRELAARRAATISRVTEHYARRTEKLEGVIAEIESNPRVLDRLHTMAERERKTFEAAMERERSTIMSETARCIQSLEARHAAALTRIGEATGSAAIVDGLLGALSLKDERKRQGAFDVARRRLTDAIIDGEGEGQLKGPEEIVPWKSHATVIRYGGAVDFLRNQATEKTLRAAAEAGNAQAKKLLERRERILAENEVIRLLVGPQWIDDRKTGGKRMGTWWAAFETRKKNDKEGVTAARKKEREENAKREAAFMRAAGEIIKRGGFMVEAPVIREVRGKKEVVGKERGVVRLEKKKPKKEGGSEYWIVAEVFGATGGLKVGNVAPLDMRSFPSWLREFARTNFTMRGDDFIERLTYET